MTCALIRLCPTDIICTANVHITKILQSGTFNGRASGSRWAINRFRSIHVITVGHLALVTAATGEQRTKEKRRSTEDKLHDGHGENETLTSKQFKTKQFDQQQTLLT